MQYHVIIGVGFSEMRTAAIKLKDKLGLPFDGKFTKISEKYNII